LRSGTSRNIPKKPLDVLLATKHDLGRRGRAAAWGLMVVAGQPKAHPPRVHPGDQPGWGRKQGRTGAGLHGVSIGPRPRDLSHYETFEHYHATLSTSHVEAAVGDAVSRRERSNGVWPVCW